MAKDKNKVAPADGALVWSRVCSMTSSFQTVDATSSP